MLVMILRMTKMTPLVARKLITVGLRNTSQTKMSPANIRQNFHDECEKSLNKQINMEMYASYTYLSLYSYFIQQDKALPRCSSRTAKRRGSTT